MKILTRAFEHGLFVLSNMFTRAFEHGLFVLSNMIMAGSEW
ncbi:hypothetical protein N9219_02360 [bacterium]|nr:hypothetical protein [bacterium]